MALTAIDLMNGYQIEANNKLMGFLGQRLSFRFRVDDRGFVQNEVWTDTGVRLMTLHVGRDGLLDARDAGVTCQELNDVLRQHHIRVLEKSESNQPPHPHPASLAASRGAGGD